MKRTSYSRFLARAAMTLLAAFFSFTGAKAQDYFYEGFEGGAMPEGWTTDGPGTWSVGTGDYSASTGAGAGTYNAMITHGGTGNVTKLITPAIDLSTATAAQLSFMHIQRSWSGDIDKLKVCYRTSPEGEWVQLAEYTDAYASWTLEGDNGEITLPNLSSTYQIAFEMTDAYGYGVGIDEVTIFEVPSCSKPTAFAVSEIGPRSAVLSWTPGSEEQDAWQICINGDEENLIDVTENPYTLTDLTPETAYTVKVRTNCGGGDFSKWNNVTFTTAIAAPVPTNVVVSNVTKNSATVSWVSEATSFNVQYKATSAEEWQTTIATENSITITGLTPETEYQVQVQGNYGDLDGLSAWSAAVSFTTLVAAPVPTALAVSDITTTSAHVSWSGIGESYDLRYVTNPNYVFQGYVTNPGAMDGGADASWKQGSQSTYGPNVNYANDFMLADDFTVYTATTLHEIEVYGYQTGSTTTSTFTGLRVQIYDGNPAEGGELIWGDMDTNIMTATSFTNCYRGSNGETSAMTRPIMAITASGLDIELEPGTYWLVYSLEGTGSSGPWGVPYSEPTVGNTGEGLHHSSSGWTALTDDGSGTPYGCAMKLTFEDLESFDWSYVNNIEGGEYDLTSLNPETTYLVQVRANYSDEGPSKWISTTFTTLPTCMVPTNLAVSNVDKRSADLAWTPNGEEDAWQICINGDEENLINVTENPYTLTGLDTETTYSVKVRAYCDEQDQSHWSAPATFTTLVACPAPTNLAVSDITRNSAVVSWTGEGDFELEYVEDVWKHYDNGVYAGTVGYGTEGMRIAWASMFPAAMLESNNLTQVALYEIASRNHNDITVIIYQGGETAPETQLYTETFAPMGADGWHEITLATPVTIDPTQNLWVVFSADDAYPAQGCADVGNINNRWTSLDNGSTWGDMTSYGVSGRSWMIRAGFDNAQTNWVTMEDATSPQEITGLTPETDYFVRVKHVCGGIDGESDWVTTMFTTDVPCSTPTALTATPYALSAKLSWVGTSDSYTVSYRQYVEGEKIVPDWQTVVVNEATAIITGLGMVTQYEWKVQGDCGEYGVSEESTIATFTTTDNLCPMPTNLVADNITATTADLSWDGSPDVESFTVRYRSPEHVVGGVSEAFDSDNTPAGWTKYSGLVDDVIAGTATLSSTTSGWNTNSYALGQYNMKVNIYGNSCKYWLVTPEVVTLANGTFTFDLALTDYGNANPIEYATAQADDRFVVLVYANDAWTILREWNNSGSEYVYNNIATTGEAVSIDLSAYVGQTVKIAFYGESTVGDSGDNDLHIDNVAIGAAETIPATEWQTVTTTETNVTLTGLTPETTYEAQVKADCSDPEEWSAVTTFTTTTDIELANDATDNGTLIEACDGKVLNVTLSGRTLFKDGLWNTICLPFDVVLEGSPLEGAIAKTLTDASTSPSALYDMHINLIFGDAVTTLEAGKPYIIRWNAADENIVDPVFENVLIEDVPESDRTISMDNGNVKFIGYYDAFGIDETDEDIFYMKTGKDENENDITTLVRTNSERILKSCRAYFQFSEYDVAKLKFTIDFGDGSTTGIVDLDREATTNSGWYTVDGKKLDKQPTRKGVYIQNGRAVVIK